MKKETKDQIDALFDKYDSSLAEFKKKQEESVQKELTFKQGFDKVAKKIIWPTMNEFVEELKDRGHNGSIHPEQLPPPFGTGMLKLIRMVVLPSGLESVGMSESPHHLPNIVFFADEHKKKVVIYTQGYTANRQVRFGHRAEVDVEELNKDSVEQHILKGVESIFQILEEE